MKNNGGWGWGMGFVLRPEYFKPSVEPYDMGRCTTDLGKHVASSSQAFNLHVPITTHVRRTASNPRLVGYVFNAHTWLVVLTPIVFLY